MLEIISCPSPSGRTWTLELDEEVSDLTTHFTDQLIRDGLMRKILTLLLENDVEKEMDNLGQAGALGDVRHRHEVKRIPKSTAVQNPDRECHCSPLQEFNHS